MKLPRNIVSNFDRRLMQNAAANNDLESVLEQDD